MFLVALVAMAEIAKLVGVATPVMDSVVVLASVLRSEDYWSTGRTLEKMGLNSMTVDEIKEFLLNGYK